MNKIYVCSIMKNEEQCIEKFYNSCKGVDGIYILDTGSTDKSIEKAESLGIHVSKKSYELFRFDVARNDALKLLPQDDPNAWIICLDLDEILDPYWKSWFENLDNSITQLRYKYIWNWYSTGKPKGIYYLSRIFRINKYCFKHATHEVPISLTETKIKDIGLIIEHHHNSIGTGKNDLKLLELDYIENPKNSRSQYYLARQYFFEGMWEEAIKYFVEYLNNPTADWRPERASAMRYIAKIFIHKGNINKTISWFYRALAEHPYCKDLYVEMCEAFKLNKDWLSIYWAGKKCLEIKDSLDLLTYMVEEDYKLWDYLSVASFHLDKKEEALIYANMALERNPKSKRLQDNVIIIKESMGVN